MISAGDLDKLLTIKNNGHENQVWSKIKDNNVEAEIIIYKINGITEETYGIYGNKTYKFKSIEYNEDHIVIKAIILKFNIAIKISSYTLDSDTEGYPDNIEALSNIIHCHWTYKPGNEQNKVDIVENYKENTIYLYKQSVNSDDEILKLDDNSRWLIKDILNSDSEIMEIIITNVKKG